MVSLQASAWQSRAQSSKYCPDQINGDELQVVCLSPSKKRFVVLMFG